MKSTDLLIATNNAGKVRELSELLSGFPLNLNRLADFDGVVEVEESGSTFEENAALKAKGYALQTGMLALADDSGLEITALGGAPGVLSARYGGDTTPFDEKIAMLLSELENAASRDRSARFVCVMAIANPMGEIEFTAEGICTGTLTMNPRGTGGFGYDPIFIPDGFDRTFGELASDIKQQISHRGRAIRKIIPFLRGFYRYLT